MSNHIYLHQGITDCCKGSKWWWCLLLALLSLCYKSLFSHG